MDVSSLGTMYADDFRMDVNALVPGYSPTARPGVPIADFSEVMRRTSAAQSVDGEEVDNTGSRTPFHGQKIDKTDKLYEQCLELETFLVKILINGMRNTVQKSGLIDTGHAGKIYEDMLYDEYAKEFTKNAGFGLADQAYLELSGQRGTRPAAN